MKEDYLFVYGTLKRNKDSPLKLKMETKTEYLEEVSVPGSLYLVSYYPGLVLNNQGVVYGELYKIIDHSLIGDLDRYEGCSQDCPKPHEYKRILIDVNTSRGCLKSWCYEYIADVNTQHRIDSGKF